MNILIPEDHWNAYPRNNHEKYQNSWVVRSIQLESNIMAWGEHSSSTTYVRLAGERDSARVDNA